ncbi:hypothetical protein MTR67_053406 [Solanum verrucosum]|uniref:F-box domain-containing protein n=1 Tax=Solanum verrucosum TaxID=315347 RepID=A0AAF0VAI0_SOLVR|nr:hypothetical protein MTR67_053406 [Solanum verrucosum]
MNGVSQMRKCAKEEICEDIMIKILDFLPSKCLAKFKCVSKCWEKYIADCRCRRWNQKPYLVGFFCQHSEITRELLFFFSSSTKDYSVIDGTFDDNLFNGKARLVIHPTVPHIFYLGLQCNIISYDFEMDVAQLVNNFSGCPTMKRYKLFPFEWHEWPRRLL